jgi:hypothetical protein
MAFFELHSGLRFSIGLIFGCWAGVTLGVVIALMLVGRRMKQLEAENQLLSERLRKRATPLARTGTTGAGPSLVSSQGIHRSVSSPLRAVGGR